MPELNASDVSSYTGGRLAADSPATGRLLGMALEAARNYCRWHVAPVRTADPFKLDGSGGRVLLLPTLALQTLDSLLEDGAAVDVQTVLRVSDDGHRVAKRSGAFWTAEIGAIEGTMTHGIETCYGFDEAVLGLLDRISYGPTGGRARAIGPIQYADDGPADPFTGQERALLDPYRIELLA